MKKNNQTLATKEITLKRKEKEFLRLVCSQLSYKDIANKMGKSPRTIDGYRDSLFENLSLTCRTGLVIYALKAKIVKLEKIKI